jgi:hypothetical protein
MLGGHIAYPKWVTFLNVGLACDSSPLGCVFADSWGVVFFAMKFCAKKKKRQQMLKVQAS